MAKLTDEQLKQTAQFCKEFGVYNAAKQLGVARTTFQSRLDIAQRRGFITAEERDSSNRVVVAGKPIADTIPDPRDVKLAAYERDNGVMRTRVKHLEKIVSDGLRIRELVFDLKGEPDPVEWALGSPDTSETHSCPIMFFSDPQWGEVVKAREMDG